MPSPAALVEEVVPLTLGGYAYSGRIVHQPAARLDPIVFVGGAFQYQNAWGRLEKGCLDAASVLTVDLPGMGAADRLPARYGFGFLANALDQFVAKAAPGRVNVLGTSYGSVVAQRWVREHPERVARLALVGAVARLTERVRAQTEHTLRLAAQGRRDDFARYVLESLTCASTQVTVTRRQTVLRCLSLALRGMSADDLAKYRENSLRLLADPDLAGAPGPGTGGPPLRRPVLVTTGEHDPLSTPALGVEAAARFHDGRFAALRDADHLVHLECPAQLVDLLLRFFSGQPLDGLDYCELLEPGGGGGSGGAEPSGPDGGPGPDGGGAAAVLPGARPGAGR